MVTEHKQNCTYTRQRLHQFKHNLHTYTCLPGISIVQYFSLLMRQGTSPQ